MQAIGKPGIAYRDRRLYVADSALGVIWTLSAKHPGVAEVWADGEPSGTRTVLVP